MGAVNYHTSDYITLGLELYSRNIHETPPELIEELQAEVDEYGGTLEEVLDRYIHICYESDYENVNEKLKTNQFHYYHITIMSGYYEGFTLNIENNYPIAFDSWEERREANKEITQIKKFLIECAGLGLVECHPGWCTGYNDYSGTINTIKAAVKEMRAELKTIPTWRQYENNKVFI